MAGYRPKSLGELNDMYDKTISAEKAIINATKKLSEEAEKPSDISAPAEEKKEVLGSVPELSVELDSIVSDYSSEPALPSYKEELNDHFVENFSSVTEEPESSDVSFEDSVEEAKKLFTQSLNEDSGKSRDATAEPPFEAHIPSEQKAYNPVYTLEAPDEIKEKQSAKSDQRSELFDDYMKIMNDEDDDFLPKYKHKKKKNSKRPLFFKKEKNIPEEEAFADDSFFGESLSEEFSDLEEEPEEIKEVIYTPEFETSPFERESSESETIANAIPEELQGKTYDEFMNEPSVDIYSFDPNKENSIPSSGKKVFSLEGEDEESEFSEPERNTSVSFDLNTGYSLEEPSEADETDELYEQDESEGDVIQKKKTGLKLGKIFLSILLALLLIFAVFTVGVNTLFGVNTGETFDENQYIFTASENYENAGLLKNDLVITEKRYANDGEVFAYINYTEQRFMFGTKTGNIVNDNGDVLFIAENSGQRVLVHRDDTRGTLFKVYPKIGGIIRLCTDGFIPVIAVVLLCCFIIVFLLFFALKDKEKAQQKLIKKMVKKGIISETEAQNAMEYDYSEEDEESLFSSIE